MGEIADSLISGEFDFVTGEYIGEPCGYPRTRSVGEKIGEIKKELKVLIKQKQKGCSTEKEMDNAVNLARQEINVKYGKGWRENT